MFLKALTAVLSPMFSMALIIFPGLLINELSGEQRMPVVLLYIGMIAGIPFLQNVTFSSLNVYLLKMRNSFLLKVNADFISHCADMDLETMENPDLQDLKERAHDTIADSLTVFDYFSGMISAALSVLMCITVIAFVNPLIILLVTFVVIVNYCINKSLKLKQHAINNEIMKYNRYGWPIVNYFYDIRYAKEIRLFNLKEFFLNIYSSKRSEVNKLGTDSAVCTRNVSIILAAVSLLQTSFLYGYFIYEVIFGEMTVGEMTICIGAVLRFSESLSNVSEQYLNLTALSLRVRDLIQFMELPCKNKNAGNIVPVFDKDSVIEFKNVSFRYPGNERFVIRNLNLTLRGKEKLCIVGENGSGKSTFVKLLTRLYIPDEGEILLNGININKYDFRLYMRLFAVAFQDYALYNITFKENIVMSEEYSADSLNRVVKQSGLSKLVENNTKGYDTVIFKWYDEEGIEPSGGEGQRIAIARALYRSGSIYILDEPTAALDPNAEYELYTQFHNMIQDKAAVLITHRLSAVKLADKVAVFSDGQVIEYGTHEELYAKGGIYKEMFDKQSEFYVKAASESNETEG
ncbi:MAG: ABC transporter ATP-binding protein [Eubacteriales bacterium]